MKNADVVVVGAGPAGSLAALRCSRMGLSVVLMEKERMPRFKACGGGFELKYLEALAKDVPEMEEETVEKKPTRVELFCGKRRLACVPFRSCSFRRDKFDHALAKAAEREGAIFLNGDGCADLREGGDFVAVKTVSGRVFRSKVLVGADGACGIVAGITGLRRPGFDPAGMAACIDLEAGLPPDFHVREPSVFLGYSAMEGYAWAFPKKSVLSIGMGTRCPNPNLNAEFSRFLKENGLSGLKALGRIGAVLPMKALARACRGRVLLAGDAAGFVDSLGGGIPYALESGRIAAGVIAGAILERDLSRLAEYDTLCKRAFRARFALANAGLALGRVFCGLSSLFLPSSRGGTVGRPALPRQSS